MVNPDQLLSQGISPFSQSCMIPFALSMAPPEELQQDDRG
jgi:hypothetical protein